MADAPHQRRMSAAEVRAWLLARGIVGMLGSEVPTPRPKPAQ